MNRARVMLLWAVWCVLQAIAIGGLLLGCLPALFAYAFLGLAWPLLKLTALAEAWADRVVERITTQGGRP